MSKLDLAIQIAQLLSNGYNKYKSAFAKPNYARDTISSRGTFSIRPKGRKATKSRVRKVKRSFRKTRTSGRRSVRRRVGKKSTMSSVKKHVSDLTPTDIITGQQGDIINGSASTVLGGMLTTYFSFNTNNPFGSQDPVASAAIAQLIVTRLGFSPPYAIKYVQTQFKLTHTIQNVCNRNVKIIGYKCRARRDIPNIGPYVDAVNSMQLILAYGFASTNVDATNRTVTNSGLFRADLTPYDSPYFVDNFKIIKTKTTKLLPGSQCQYTVNDPKSHVINPDRFLDMSTIALTYGTAPKTLIYIKGETFWLFRMVPLTIENIAAATVSIDFSNAKCDMYTKYEYSYKYNPNITQRTDNFATVNIVVPSGVGANNDVILEQSGTIVQAANI